MAGIARAFASPCCRPGKAKKTLVVAVALTFMAFGAALPRAAGQSIGDYPGATPQTTRPNPQGSRLPPESPDVFPKTGPKRNKALLDDNFKKLKEHAQNLAELAKSLQAEIEKSNENVLSLEIIKKADEAEKLARKIKSEAKGF
ncbi:MAG: hypothetical protein EPN47_19245 [Acidobacteria bacterium]|nr:MAG: hypothetical protein EPN47_19245 [Acidobacteriota bacterium]